MNVDSHRHMAWATGQAHEGGPSPHAIVSVRNVCMYRLQHSWLLATVWTFAQTEGRRLSTTRQSCT
eukprot:1501472-Amphidinium_carterae.1